MKIDIAAISIDIENFRHGEVKAERDAILALLSNEKEHRVAELAQDIVAQGGLDPSSLLIVADQEGTSGRYIALEGNRRITALKAMMTPELAAGTPTASLFRSLHPKFLGLGLTQVECVVMDRQQASVWIKRKHYKGMGGAGVRQWNAVATARSDASEGRFTRWMSVLAFIEENGIDAEEIRDAISGKTTTVERVLSSSHMSTVLGVTISVSGTVTAENSDQGAAAKLLSAMMDSMAEREFKETLVSSADQQFQFISRFTNLSVKKVQKATGAGHASSGRSPATGGGGSGGTGASPSTAGGPAGASGSESPAQTAAAGGSTIAIARSNPVRTRKKLAEKGLHISNQALNRFYSELRKLDVTTYPFISNAIVRIFLEKASTVFLEEMAVPPLNSQSGATWHDFNVKLKDKVKAVLQIIDPTGNDPRLSAARDVANGNRDKLHTADKLNEAIHSHHSLPSSNEVITIWDRFHPYFSVLFDHLEANRSR